MSEKSEHEGHRARLRERFLAGEAASRSDEALLELLLAYAITQRDVQPLAKTLISHFGSLDKVLTADPEALCKIDGTGTTTAALLKVVDFLRRNLHKPAVVSAEVRAEDRDLEQQLADAVRQHLQTLPGRIKAEPGKYSDEHRTTATINSMCRFQPYWRPCGTGGRRHSKRQEKRR